MAPDAFLDWLERTAPTVVSADAGKGASDAAARLADAMDELDAILLTSLEEIARVNEAAMTRDRVKSLPSATLQERDRKPLIIPANPLLEGGAFRAKPDPTTR